MSKVIKKMEFDALESTFKGVRDLLLIAPTKVDSGMDTACRKTLREKNVHVQMVKNSLAKRIFDAQGVAIDPKLWTGTTWVAWGPESIKELSQAVDNLIKDIEKKDPKAKNKLVVKTAIADGQPVPMSVAITMPTRLEAIGEIIAMMMGPASEIAAALGGPGGQIASQIATIAEKKEDEPAAAAA